MEIEGIVLGAETGVGEDGEFRKAIAGRALFRYRLPGAAAEHGPAGLAHVAIDLGQVTRGKDDLPPDAGTTFNFRRYC